MPRVSMNVCVLDQPEMLRDSLKSIHNQTFKDWECLIVDDGSRIPVDSIVNEFKDPRFKLHRFPVNKGIPHGGNFNFRRSTGDYICSLGCDELIHSTKFEDQVKYLDEHPEIDCIWGVRLNGPMGPVPEWEQYEVKCHNRSKELWLKCFLQDGDVPLGGASAMWRRSLFEKLGYFDDKLTVFSDHEFFCRIFENCKFKVLPYRWMNEVPGGKKICTLTNNNIGKANEEWAHVQSKHGLIMPPSEGLVTVAMPCFNHARFIGESLKSVLAQTDQNFEILITDDGSTDDVKAAISGFDDPRISFERSQTNCGHMVTVNKMLEKAKGEFFISFSCDDTMSPNLIEKLRAEFKRDPFLEHVASQNDFMHEDGRPYTEDHPLKTIQKAVNRPKEEWHELFYRGNVYFGINMYRTSALKEVGGWDPRHGVISDYEMYLKLLPRYNFRIVEEPLTHTRIHGQNQSLLSPEEAKKLPKRYFDAQRSYYRPRPKIIIATPFYQVSGFSPYIKSLTETTRYLTLSGINWEFMDLSGDSYVHRARNSICMNFLNDPYATDLFFIDSDMSWDVASFIAMIFRPEPVLAGTYPVKNKWEMWTSKPRIADPDTDPHFMGHPLPDGSALLEANQLAGGFLRIKRSVLEKFMEFYPTYKYHDTHPIPEQRTEQVEFFTAGLDREPEVRLLQDIEMMMNQSNGNGVDLTSLKPRFDELKQIRQFVGEDYCFSNRLRNMGIQLFIYPNATISHFGMQGWTGNFNEFLKNQGKEQQKAAEKAAEKAKT